MSSRPVTAPNLPVVACHDVVRDFPQAGAPVRVLHGVNCEIQAGELVLLTGPSGCGKTTLVSVIGGILSPTAGSVRVFGRPLESLNGRDLAAFRLRHFGFVFQQFHLLPGLTAVENAALPLAASGLPRREAIGRAAALLETLGLRDHLGKFPRALSGGQQQRVAIARALIHDPDLLICDEPTSALDSQAGAAVMALLRAVTKERHRSCIIVTHDPRIENLADRILRMEDGRLIPSAPIPCA